MNKRVDSTRRLNFPTVPTAFLILADTGGGDGGVAAAAGHGFMFH